jgi:hypothetical protein
VKGTVMLDDRTKALLRMVIYPVQFEASPVQGMNRVTKMIARNISPGVHSSDIVKAINLALTLPNEKLSEIVPQSHNEEAIRSYLKVLSQALSPKEKGSGAFTGFARVLQGVLQLASNIDDLKNDVRKMSDAVVQLNERLIRLEAAGEKTKAKQAALAKAKQLNVDLLRNIDELRLRIEQMSTAFPTEEPLPEREPSH